MKRSERPRFAVFVAENDKRISPWFDSHFRAGEWTELHTDLGMPEQPVGYMVVSIDGRRYRQVEAQ